MGQVLHRSATTTEGNYPVLATLWGDASRLKLCLCEDRSIGKVDAGHMSGHSHEKL
jgi:hypothetical protein